MTKELDLQDALAALEQYRYDKKHSTDLEQARNKQQMAKYIDSLDFSLRRLELLQEVVTEAISTKKRLLAQKENIQTYKTKLINLSREWNMSYQDVVDLMAKVENNK